MLNNNCFLILFIFYVKCRDKIRFPNFTEIRHSVKFFARRIHNSLYHFSFTHFLSSTFLKRSFELNSSPNFNIKNRLFDFACQPDESIIGAFKNTRLGLVELRIS